MHQEASCARKNYVNQSSATCQLANWLHSGWHTCWTRFLRVVYPFPCNLTLGLPPIVGQQKNRPKTSFFHHQWIFFPKQFNQKKDLRWPLRLRKRSMPYVWLFVLFLFVSFEWTPSRRKESGHPIIMDFASCSGNRTNILISLDEVKYKHHSYQ